MLSGKMILSLRLATILELVLVVLSILYMFQKLGFKDRTKLIGLTAFFGIRGFMGGDLIGLGYSTDSMYYVMLFLTIGYFASKLDGVHGKIEKVLKIAIPLLAFIYGLGGIKLLIILFLPFFLYHACVNLWRANFNLLNKNGILWELGLWTVLCLVGYLILSIFIANERFGPILLASGESVGLYYAVVENIPALLKSFLQDTPLDIIKDANIIFSPLTVNGFVFLFFIFYMIYLLPIVFKKSNDIKNIALKYIGVSVVFTFFLMMIHLDRSFISSTDLMYIYPFLAILIAVYYSKLSKENDRLAHLYIMAFGFMIILNTLSNLYLNSVNIENNSSGSVVKNTLKIKEILDIEGIDRGYALYWDSYPIEVLTEGKIKMAVVNGDLTPIKNRTLISNYDQELASEKVAFVYSIKSMAVPPEYNDINNDNLLKKASRRFIIDDKIRPVDLYIFDKNYFTFGGEEAVAALNNGMEPETQIDASLPKQDENTEFSLDTFDLTTESQSNDDEPIDSGVSDDPSSNVPITSENSID
jgi:hypothetical protein